MLFNSYAFIFAFLPLTFVIYFYLNHKRLTKASKGFLLFSSLFFYSWWDISYLPLLSGSILFNYIAGRVLVNGHSGRRVNKRRLLLLGITANVALLAYFKYADFFIANIDLVTGAHITLLHLTLPLAISFFTFQQIAYLVDSYRGETKEYDFLNYAVFVSFFPQLIAGPIVHHKEMMPQFANIRHKVMNYRNIALGLSIFSIGLFKKVIIADTFAVWATLGFDSAQTLNLLEAWTTSLSYTFQLYFDFSGYTDMAIGAALLFNIRLPINFNSPYKALHIQEFWHRWHITLSRFLRDYVYIPMGGNRRGDMRMYSNIMATFIIGGIWHGAGWTFVLWGALHGLATMSHIAWTRLGLRMNKALAWFITFNFLNITWVFFRAEEFDDAIKVLGSMFSLEHIVLPAILAGRLASLQQYGVEFGDLASNLQVHSGIEVIAWLVIGFILIWLPQNSNAGLKSRILTSLNAVITAIGFILALLSLDKVSEFLYFNF